MTEWTGPEKMEHGLISTALQTLGFIGQMDSAVWYGVFPAAAGWVVAAALVASFSQSSPLEDERDHANTVREHASIVDAIEAQDERAAAAAMLKVIEIGVQRVAGSRSARKRK